MLEENQTEGPPMFSNQTALAADSVSSSVARGAKKKHKPVEQYRTIYTPISHILQLVRTEEQNKPTPSSG